MKRIVEGKRKLVVTPSQEKFLLARGLVEDCSDCGCLHHEEYERWDEIDVALKEHADAVQALFGSSEPQ